MTLKACKNCIFFSQYFGNKDSSGKRTLSNYWCVKKNGFIRNFPKQCGLKKTTEDEHT